MSFLKQLNQIDTDLLIFLNSFHSSFFDGLMYQATQTIPWFPVYALLIGLIIKTHKWKSVWILLAITLVVTASDQFTSTLMKPFFERLRPCWEPELATILHIPHGCGGRYGFASSHAADTFGAGFLVFLILRKYKLAPFIFLWPAISSYSRIYLAAHYPGDILVGMVVGIVFAVVGLSVLNRFQLIS